MNEAEDDIEMIQRRSQNAERYLEQRRLNGLAILLSNQDGRRWLHALLQACHRKATPFTGNNDLTNFKLGEHNVGLRIVADIEAIDPAYIVVMEKEAKEDAC